MSSKKLNITTSGATAVVGLIYPDETNIENRKLLVANVGDSRAILASRMVCEGIDEAVPHGFYAHRLSYDHRAEDIGEQKNLSATNPEKVKALTQAWNQWNKDLEKPAWGQQNLKAKKKTN